VHGKSMILAIGVKSRLMIRSQKYRDWTSALL